MFRRGLILSGPSGKNSSISRRMAIGMMASKRQSARASIDPGNHPGTMVRVEMTTVLTFDAPANILPQKNAWTLQFRAHAVRGSGNPASIAFVELIAFFGLGTAASSIHFSRSESPCLRSHRGNARHVGRKAPI